MKLFTRATVTGTTLSGASLKSSLTTLWDALKTAGFSDGNRTTVTSTSTLATTQCGLLLVDCTSGNITLTLPTSGADTDDAFYNIRRIDGTANTLTIQRGGSDTIEGATAGVTLPPLGLMELQMPAGGANWRIVGLGSASANAQSLTAFTSAGTAPAYTLTPSPALTSLAANQRFRIKFHSATTGAATLAVNGLTATAIKQYDSGGTKVDPTIAANQLCDVEYDGTHWVMLDPLPSGGAQLQPIGASVSGNALTISASSLALDFRSATLTSGTITRVSGTPSNLVISSGSTLGTTNGVQSDIAVLAVNNAGALELAAVNLAGGVDLSETGLISTTAEGGAGAADSVNVVYSTTARVNVAYRLIGVIRSTQATAGTWATAPSLIQGVGGKAQFSQLSIGTAVATTSGTSIDFTGIPSFVKRVTVMLRGISTSGTSLPIIQLGSGSILTSGYKGASWNGSGGAVNYSSGFLLTSGASATDLFHAQLILCHMGGNIWTASLGGGYETTYIVIGGGSVSLSGVMDRLRLTTVNGTDTFDAGSVNIMWE